MEQIKICSFTGHRPQNLPFRFDEQDRRCRKLKRVLRQEIKRQIKEAGVCHFISGMAIGVDMYAAEIVLDLKRKYPQITLEAAIPCENQSEKWPLPLQRRYDHILSQCDKRTLMQQHYTPDCMHRRNRYMVDSAQTVIAVWNGNPSGTGETVRYATEQGKSIVIIHPESCCIASK